ncbi:HIT-like domain-containing protein [Dunaliella salina]|uniref:HIT-like domain-containing protein n=1 Tax=Dunaliella salina TaxID=3046 RepID=A0ABQ7GZL5_DUNSA|nr:HIT-like domain-containing protein [Dunaliella salina]|eukprot:KAF5839986.1 HIT-like domain-containing protein [Dunaliella salina]
MYVRSQNSQVNTIPSIVYFNNRQPSSRIIQSHMKPCSSLSRSRAFPSVVFRPLVHRVNMGNSNSQEQRHQVDVPFLQQGSLGVQGCIFCDIVHDKTEKSPLIFQSPSLVAFPDLYPAALEHFLVVPRIHIDSVRTVKTSDLELIREMHATGQRLLQELRPNHTYMMGYHLPPFTSIHHLHLHCFALPFKHWTKQIKYILPCVWMSAEDFERQLSEAASKNSP